MLKYLIFILIILFSKNLYSLETEWSIGPESKVRLISPISHNNNENKLILGIEYELNEGWKTYWKSPGEGGFPQQINWELSKNIKIEMRLFGITFGSFFAEYCPLRLLASFC